MHGLGVPRSAVLRLLQLNLTPPADLSEQVSRALREDIGPGDVTARLIPPAQAMRARVVCRDDAVLCGTAWFEDTFRQVNPAVSVEWQCRDGATVSAGQVLCSVAGPAQAILTGERTALNFLQLLSGVATVTRRYVEAVAGTGCRILDTRKTLPGLRTAQKYAVRCGGGENHRIGLFDMVLVKENHIAAAGSIDAAVSSARRQSPGIKVEVEVENLQQLEQALTAGPDIIMLDDFALPDLREAVRRNRAHARPVLLEASGGVSLEGIRSIAAAGVDFISVGALTKHVHAVDLSMRYE